LALSQPTIAVFGDSHSALFQPTPFYGGRLGLKVPLPYRINGRVIAAASVAGFRPGKSTLMVKETIREALPDAERVILAFGQVDLELGYYYRRAIKGEAISPDAYVDALIGIYAAFVADLPVAHCRLALKGVNLTALAPRAFATRYVARIVKDGTTLTWDQAQARVEPFILSEDAQNEMHLRFNDALAAFAGRMGHAYFDLVGETGNGSARHLSAMPLRLADEYRVGGFDHHLADTVAVRRMHYVAAGRAFGLA
jgi:hypothetical protein